MAKLLSIIRGRDFPSKLSQNDPPPKYEATENIISSLRRSEHRVEKAFRNVSDGLDRAMEISKEKKCLFKKDSRSLEEFKSKWEALRNTYLQKVWESRTVAGVVRTYAEDFSGPFFDTITDTVIPLDKRLAEINRYQIACAGGVDKAQKLSQAFRDLHRDVVTFSGELREFSSQRCHSIVKAEMEKVIVDMSKVKQKLERAKKIADALTKISDVGGVVKCLNSLVFFCPALLSVPGSDLCIVSLIGEHAAEAIHGSSDYQALSEKYGKLKRRKAEFQCIQDGVDEIKKITSSLNNDTDIIQTELVIFGDIWAAIASDLVTIQTKLELASNTGLEERLIGHGQVISGTYSKLVNALKEYEIKITID